MSAYATDGLKMSPYGNNWNIEFSKKRTELKTVRFFNISIDRAFALFTNNTFIATRLILHQVQSKHLLNFKRYFISDASFSTGRLSLYLLRKALHFFLSDSLAVTVLLLILEKI